jgi:hypothetical protein
LGFYAPQEQRYIFALSGSHRDEERAVIKLRGIGKEFLAGRSG